MPDFGNPASIGEGEYIYYFTWADWDQWPSLQKTGTTPERVLWQPKSGCLEKYHMVPSEPVIPED